MKTIVGLFDHFSEAEAVVRDLERAGYDRGTISIVANERVRTATATSARGDDVSAAEGAGTGAVIGGVTGGMAGLIASLAGLAIPGVGAVLLAGPLMAALTGAGVGAVAGGLIGALTTAGVPEEHARYYEEGVRRGGTLVTVSASDADADRVMDIMNRHNPVDIEERATEWRRTGALSAPSQRPAAQTTTTMAAAAAPTTRQDLAGKQAIPVVEEELQVRKRQVERGGIRVYSHMQERPVEEQVNLREERVRVERRPADRPADAGDIGRAFKEGTIEVTEHVEQPVVQKNARVVEEVVVGKEASERTETVRDTVRKTDVQVEQVGAAGSAGGTDFDRLENDFRTNFQQSFPGNEYSYDQVKPVYRYGHTLAAEHRGQDWNSFENDARRGWEERNPGTWDRFKNAARYAWERTKDKVS